MADWQRTLNLAQEFSDRRAGNITISQLAEIVANKLELIPKLGIDHLDDERDNLVCEFRDMAADSTADVEDFDTLLSDLYDWGDYRIDGTWSGKKVCWIETISLPKGQRKTAT